MPLNFKGKHIKTLDRMRVRPELEMMRKVRLDPMGESSEMLFTQGIFRDKSSCPPVNVEAWSLC